MLLGRARCAYTRLLFLAREQFDLLVPRDTSSVGGDASRRDKRDSDSVRQAEALSRVRMAFRRSLFPTQFSSCDQSRPLDYSREEVDAQISRDIERAEYVIREIEALIKLHKYRAMKKRYYDDDQSRR